jgi:hypothetical protein
MSRDIAGEIEKEYGQINSSFPFIVFGYNSIEMRQRPGFTDYAFLLTGPAGICSMFILFVSPPVLLLIVLLLFFISVIIYNYHGFFDTITIDFLQKELRIENKFSVINSLRKFFNKKTNISFNDIAYFMIDDGKRPYHYKRAPFNLYRRRTTLFVVPAYKRPVSIVHFQFERDARRLGELLQYYIVGKPGIKN